MNAPALLLIVLLLPAATAAEPPANHPPPAARKPVVWNNELARDFPGVTHHVLQSPSMQRDVGYCVYLPPGYAGSGDSRYPVIYFLHGAGGNETSDGPGFSAIVGRLIAAGSVPPVICVFPNGGMSHYRDLPAEGILVETMILDELVPLIDASYRTRPRRESRVLAGYSMGGGGAVRLALRHPDVFSAAAAFAGGFASGRGHPDTADDILAAMHHERPKIRLLMISGYKDEATYASQAPLIAALAAAEYPFTYRTLADVPHKLGLYYDLTGEYLVRFLLDSIATDATTAPVSTFWVAPAPMGDDTHPGTREQPWATPHHAITRVGPGDTVVFRSGTYRVDHTIQLDRSGTADAPITLRGYPDERPVFDGLETLLPPEGVNTGLAAQHVEITHNFIGAFYPIDPAAAARVTDDSQFYRHYRRAYTIPGDHPVLGDPGLADPASGNLLLHQGSPARAAGLASAPGEPAPDLGAFRFVTSFPPDEAPIVERDSTTSGA